jgi:hypothetical protein
MISPYLERPIRPLAVALRQVLQQIEAEIAGNKAVASERLRIRRRTELVRWLLAPRLIT